MEYIDKDFVTGWMDDKLGRCRKGLGDKGVTQICNMKLLVTKRNHPGRSDTWRYSVYRYQSIYPQSCRRDNFLVLLTKSTFIFGSGIYYWLRIVWYLVEKW